MQILDCLNCIDIFSYQLPLPPLSQRGGKYLSKTTHYGVAPPPKVDTGMITKI